MRMTQGGKAIFKRGTKALLLGSIALLSATVLLSQNYSAIPEFVPGVAYTNYIIRSAPWSVHVARVSRAARDLEFHSVHARGKAIGLGRLTEMIQSIQPGLGRPLIGLNGDFYQRERSYAGDPRGVQIVNGDLISSPAGGAGFWVDTNARPHLANIRALFQLQWHDGRKSSFGINEERGSSGVVLYTPDIGPSTRTSGGREFVLARAGDSPWLPLQPGLTYRARVTEVREGGNSIVPPDKMVLSVGRTPSDIPTTVASGTEVSFLTATSPSLEGVRTAIGGGPILLLAGQKEKFTRAGSANPESYQIKSMLERHPRSAIGWNQSAFFFVEVDGRQEISVGMTLPELADFLLRLGCSDAMNLDGGGSATFWCDGKVRNSPCDRREREIANALILVRHEQEGSCDSAAAPTGKREAAVTP